MQQPWRTPKSFAQLNYPYQFQLSGDMQKIKTNIPQINIQTKLNFTQTNNKNKQNQTLDILNCFDNLSLVIQDQANNKNMLTNSQARIQCMQSYQVDKFQSHVCVQPNKCQKWSLSNSIEFNNQSLQKTFIKQPKIVDTAEQHIFLNRQANKQQKSKMAESILQEYSFNVEQSRNSSAFNLYLPPSKAPFSILIQKLDAFLNKQSNRQKNSYGSSKPSTVNNSGIVLNYLTNSLKENSNKNSQLNKDDSNSQGLTKNCNTSGNNLLQRVQFYASYIQNLQEQNICLKANQQGLLQQNEVLRVQVNKLDNNLKQKDIIIKYLTEQIATMSNNHQHSKLPKPTLGKRNTVDAQLLNQNSTISTFGCSPNKASQRRNSQYRQSNYKILDLSFNKNKQNFNINKKQQKKQKQKKKVQNISSQRLSFGSFADSSNYKNLKKGYIHQFQQVPQMIKKQNQILITKLNILYQDYQNLISKFNQMCSQKEAQAQFGRKNSKKDFVKEKAQQYAYKINYPNLRNNQSVLQLGYENRISQIIRKIKAKKNLKKNYSKSTFMNTFGPQFQLQQAQNVNINRPFETEDSRGIFQIKQQKTYQYKASSRHQRTKSGLTDKLPISQPQTQRIFFNKDMKPAIYSYNNSFHEEANDSKESGSNLVGKKSLLQVDFKKNKQNKCQVQKNRTRQAPKTQRSNNSQNMRRVMKIQ